MKLKLINRTNFSILLGLVALLLFMPAVLVAQEKIVFSSNRDDPCSCLTSTASGGAEGSAG